MRLPDGAAVIAGEKESDDLKLGTPNPCKVIVRRRFDLEVRV